MKDVIFQWKSLFVYLIIMKINLNNRKNGKISNLFGNFKNA